MDAFSFLTLALFFVISFLTIWGLSKYQKRLNKTKRHKYELRLRTLCLTEFPSVFIPTCTKCSNKGWTKETSGAMVKQTRYRTCFCRSPEAWLLSLSDKWIKDGNNEQAIELLAILEKIF